ncbi:MAG: SIS domain-containing protein [Anaerolineae bacterium]
MAQESLVRQEIQSQPRVWQQVWEHLQEARQTVGGVVLSQCWDGVYFAGCGSTYYLALASAAVHQQVTGQQTRGVPSSEVALFTTTVYPDAPGQTYLLVALSRSGTTTETLLAVEQHQARGLPAVAITTVGTSPLVRQCQAAIVLAEAAEGSVPQTRSFTSMFLASQYLAGLMADDESYLATLGSLAAYGEDILERSAKPAAQLAQAGWERIIYLGSGPYYGLACEGMLTAKEMGLAWSEAYHFPELRHGPLALVDERTLVIGLLSDAGGRVEQAVLADARELGAITLAIGDQPPADLARHTIALRTGLSDPARGALNLLPLQLLAVELAHARGLDPDAPRHLQPAVLLEGV